MDTKEIQIKDYNYPLPDERIAKFPLPERDSSKLLVYKSGEVTDDVFRSLPHYLPKGALMVFNNTKVIRARLHFRKKTLSSSPFRGREEYGNNSQLSTLNSQLVNGALIEVFLLEPASPVEYQENFIATSECSWYCLVGNSKKWKEGLLFGEFQIGGTSYTISAERVASHGTSFEIRFRWEGNFAFSEVLESLGELPIPPYLNRKTEESDLRTYQTVYSKIKGSVAAPTAGLHFTERVLADLDAHGIEREELTLHVGAGTFKPVKSETIEGHDMHTEFISVPRSVIEDIYAFELHRPEGARFVATGTTSVRTLESLYFIGEKLAGMKDFENVHPEDLVVHQWEPYDEVHSMSLENALKTIIDYLQQTGQDNLVTATQILIAPGFQFRLVEAMVTNFHMPQSTLLLLVSAFVDGDSLVGEHWHNIYRYALQHDFRFLSYGDSSLLFKQS